MKFYTPVLTGLQASEMHQRHRFWFPKVSQDSMPPDTLYFGVSCFWTVGPLIYKNFMWRNCLNYSRAQGKRARKDAVLCVVMLFEKLKLGRGRDTIFA